MLNPVHGSFNALLQTLAPGLPDFVWLSDPRLAFPSLIVANVWRGYPLVMVMLLAGLMAIPREHYEAAVVDGAGVLRRLLHVTLPGLRTLILVALALDMVWEFRRFALVLIMTGGGPNGSTTTIMYYIYNNAFQWFNMGYAAAISWFLFVVIFLMTLFYWRVVGKSVHYY